MKLFNILTAGVLLCAGLASCEMKDELKGSGEGSSDMGYLDLGVAVNASQNNVSRAGDVTDEGENENVGVSIPTGDFPVIITNVDDTSEPIEYESFDKLKEENKDGIVALPVGTYTVTAHSNDELETEMLVPYYEGTEEINITKDVQSKAEVVCTMKNTKIALSYDTEFIANFTDWEITVTDGTTILKFTCTNNKDTEQLNPAPKYMLVADGISKLTVHASGHNLQGEFVSEERVLTKPAGGNSANWTGGDALTITMEENTPADPTGVQGSGITITADVEFEESDATIEVPVTPGGSTEEPGGGTEEPGTGGDDEQKPTVSSKYLGQTITFSKEQNNAPTDVVVEMFAPNGIQHVYIKATTSDTSTLQGIFTAIGFMSEKGVDFVGLAENEAAGEIAPLFEDLPEIGDTSYSFKLGSLATMLTVGDHSFTVTVVDQEGVSSDSAIVKFNVTE